MLTYFLVKYQKWHLLISPLISRDTSFTIEKLPGSPWQLQIFQNSNFHSKVWTLLLATNAVSFGCDRLDLFTKKRKVCHLSMFETAELVLHLIFLILTTFPEKRDFFRLQLKWWHSAFSGDSQTLACSFDLCKAIFRPSTTVTCRKHCESYPPALFFLQNNFKGLDIL